MPAGSTPKRLTKEPGIVARALKGGRITYEIRVEYRDARNQTRSRWKTVGPDLRAARKELARAKVAADDGRVRSAAADHLTVAVALREHFLPYSRQRVEVVNDLDAGTLRKYAEYVEHKVIPLLGHIPLA